MKRIAIIAAAAIVLIAHLWALFLVSQNRSAAPGGTVELTERELRLDPIGGESTALFLRLDWDALSDPPDRRYDPKCLDAAKLSELGFDCSVPVTNATAPRHYRSMMPRPVLFVLEYDGEAWKQAPMNRHSQTRLFVVDAGLDPNRLRENYADTNRYIIARGLVRLHFQTHAPRGGKRLPQPRLQGGISTVLPHQIFVPRPHRELLKDLTDFQKTKYDRRESEPRFAATISWGNNYEPWVRSVRLLSPAP